MPDLEVEPPAVSTLFDARKSQTWYGSLKRNYGSDCAYKIALPVLSEDLYSQAWELIDTQKPYKTRYFAKIINGEKKLVHESDLYSDKDILEGIDPAERRGLVYAQILNAKNRILQAEAGDVFYWVSPQQDKQKESGSDCSYKDTFTNKAEIGPNGVVLLSQHKSSKLDTRRSIDLMRTFDPSVKIADNDLDGLLLSIGSSKTPYSDSMINKTICGLTNTPILSPDVDMDSVKKRADYKAIKYLRALETITDPSELTRYHAQILLEVVDDSPSSRIIRDEYGVRIIAACTNLLLRSNSVKGLTSSYTSSEEKVEYHKGDCEKCKEKNTEIGPCNICKKCE